LIVESWDYYDKIFFMTTNQKVIQQRLSAVRQYLPDWGVEGLLISTGSNRRWLSGFTGSSGFLIVTPGRALIGTDFRYWSRAEREAPDFELVKMEGSLRQRMAILLKEAAVSSLAVEGDMTLNELALLEELEEFPIEYKPVGDTVEPLRQAKSAAEIKAIRAAAAITDQAMSAVNEIVRPGMSEKQIAWELEKLMREAGADKMAFPVIVASGPTHAASAHHTAGDRKVKAGDTIIVDMGASLNGYNSDLTRTFYLGGEPDQKFWDIYNLVHEAQKAALNRIKAGERCREVDKAARDMITEAGYGQQFGHGLGHGVGLEVHENPRLSYTADEKDTLPAGAVVTVEPGVYIEGWGGVRIEDLVMVTDSGVELLSHCSKNPIIPV
jgi:Xaa-Pro aminopeptidase